MSNLTVAFITPSYRRDFRQCSLLCHSMDRWVTPPCQHYLVVDRRDCHLFRPLEGPRRKILEVESVAPWWLRRVPGLPKFWISFKTPPVRNWILQQIVKLTIARQVPEEVLVFVDSDVAFIRPFSPQAQIVDGRLPLFRVMDGGITPSQLSWNRTTGRLLGFDTSVHRKVNYVGNLIFWRKQNLAPLYQRVEAVTGREFVRALCYQWTLSEYDLYGTFAEHFLKEASSHYFQDYRLTHNHWAWKEMSRQDLEKFVAGVQPYHVGIMITSRSGIDIDFYRHLVDWFKD